MPVDWSRYPADWQDVRARILKRAERDIPWPFALRVPCCEWCGAPDRFYVVRRHDDPSQWDYDLDPLGRGGEVFVILTVAHLGTPHADGTPGNKHDKHDVRPENLAALCNRCHLLFDLDDHVRHAAQTRRRKRVEAGQVLMLPELADDLLGAASTRAGGD